MSAVTSDSGIIQSARVSFIVVAISSASGLNAFPAPTTELVSWMAIAAQVPNCWSFIPNQWPRTGKTKRAMALRMNIVPSAIDMSESLALSTGPTAAMALPPHIAVPELTR